MSSSMHSSFNPDTLLHKNLVFRLFRYLFFFAFFIFFYFDFFDRGNWLKIVRFDFTADRVGETWNIISKFTPLLIRFQLVELDDNEVIEELDLGASDVDRFCEGLANSTNHVLSTLCLVSQLENELIFLQSIPHICFFVITLSMNILEDYFTLLDEGTL